MPSKWTPDPTVDALAGAVVDGDRIDWTSVDSTLRSSDDHSVAAGLRTLSELSSAGHHPATLTRTSRRLPLLLEGARLLAIVRTFIGIAAAIFAIYQLRVPRLGAMLATQCAFAVVAALLEASAGDRRTRSLATCFWIMAGSFSAGAIPWLARTWPQLVGLQQLAYLHSDPFIAAGLWQFARDFPSVTRFGALDRVSSVAVRVTLVVGAALFIANAAPLLTIPAIPAALAPYQRLNPTGVFWTITFGCAIPALAVMAWRARWADRTEARRVRLFLTGIVLAMAPTLVEVLLEGLFPRFKAIAATPAARDVGAWIIYPSMMVLPAMTAYALTLQNVFECRVVMVRGLRYLLARWVVAGNALIPMLLLAFHLYRDASHPLRDVLSQPTVQLELAWLFVAGALLMGHRRIVGMVNRWATVSVEEPSTLLAQLTARLKHARTALEVARELAAAIERALQAPTHAYVFRRGSLTPTSAAADAVPSESVIPILLEGAREPCFVGPGNRQSYHALLLRQDRAWVDRNAIEMLVPVMAGRTAGPLVGMVAIEQRGHARIGSREQIRFLRAAAGAASLACDAVRAEDSRAAEPDELALECTDCGVVRPWTSPDDACVCTSVRRTSSALPLGLHNRFRIQQRIGAGGMGVVYRATDVRLSRDVAIKTLSRLSSGAASRLRLEAKAMAALTHPHVAVVFAVEEWRGTPLVVMEYLSGGTLAARLRQGPLAVGDGIALTLLLARALEHMHRAGQFHGDIKPSNVGFSADGVVKFLDFGLSRAIVADEPTGNGALVAGTPAYMSPEMRDGAPAGFETDTWALSLLLYECVTGVNPFVRATSGRDVTSRLAAALQAPGIVAAPSLQDLLTRAFAPVSERVVSTATALRTELESLMETHR